MYNLLQSIHSAWAYVALIVLLFAAANAIVGLVSQRTWSRRDFKISLFGMVFTHIQLIIGLLLLFVSPYWDVMMSGGMGEVMKDSTVRLYVVEHPTINILAIILITIGWSRHKKRSESGAKFKSVGIFYTLGLVFLLSRIPWQAWLG